MKVVVLEWLDIGRKLQEIKMESGKIHFLWREEVELYFKFNRINFLCQNVCI